MLRRGNGRRSRGEKQRICARQGRRHHRCSRGDGCPHPSCGALLRALLPRQARQDGWERPPLRALYRVRVLPSGARPGQPRRLSPSGLWLSPAGRARRPSPHVPFQPPSAPPPALSAAQISPSHNWRSRLAAPPSAAQGPCRCQLMASVTGAIQHWLRRVWDPAGHQSYRYQIAAPC